MILDKIKKHYSSSVNLALLFSGKLSGIAINLIFIPFYSRSLGEYGFGIAATILSLQAMLIMLDLGFSTYLGRQAAVSQSEKNPILNDLMAAESFLLGFYLLAAFLAFLAFALGAINKHSLVIFFSIILFLLLVLQNIYYVVICARKKYVHGSVILSVGNLFRAAVSFCVLKWLSPEIDYFIMAQVLTAFFHMVISRYYAFKFIGEKKAFPVLNLSIKNGAVLIKKTYSLAIFSLAGALVTQLDKPVITYFINAKAVAAYFLAMTICMVPIGILAGPVAQYFQPKIISLVGRDSSEELYRVSSAFLYVLIVIVFFPCAVLWVFRDGLIKLWLGDVSYHENISLYVKVMLPSLAVGALGFFPYSLLLAAKDFRFQANLSVFLTTITIPCVIFSAFKRDVLLICVVYSFYHVSSTMLSWWRACLVEHISHVAQKKILFIIFPILIVLLNIILNII
ncbi:lipopolysaccharide biosynthesis protein [Vogesella mureinivorans]|uniref:lipopolysaccharide biosynthesis protein n=1 Tax=Vogesella mureinivorans TaxID=657276 RepID=UPI0011CC9C02|nr:oligosaccharide flippase family protein [Vogesella mureinivorans]